MAKVEVHVTVPQAMETVVVQNTAAVQVEEAVVEHTPITPMMKNRVALVFMEQVAEGAVAVEPLALLKI